MKHILVSVNLTVAALTDPLIICIPSCIVFLHSYAAANVLTQVLGVHLGYSSLGQWVTWLHS